MRVPARENDTSIVVSGASAEDVFDIQAAHIRFSDSLNEQLQRQYGCGKLPAPYNFDNFDGDLRFDTVSGRYMLSKLYLAKEPYEMIKPVALFFSGDTLYLSDSCYRGQPAPQHSDFHFEELRYVFRTRRRVVRIRDYDFIRSIGSRVGVADSNQQRGSLRGK